MRRDLLGKPIKLHPYRWLWEPLEGEAGFVLRPMFGGKSVYLDGLLYLYFSAKTEPWRGLLVCTDRERQPALLAEFPSLVPHPVLPKWLYLSEAKDVFEPVAERLVELARRRDPRLGVQPGPRKASRKSTRLPGRPGKTK